jgi:hypothetical protein
MFAPTSIDMRFSQNSALNSRHQASIHYNSGGTHSRQATTQNKKLALGEAIDKL